MTMPAWPARRSCRPLLGFAILIGFACTLGESIAAAAEPTAADAALAAYFYGEFPRQIAAINARMALVEAERAYLQVRLAQTAPARSFGRYSAVAAVEASLRIALLANEQEAACLRAAESELWRQRQTLGAAVLLGGGSDR